MALYVGKCLALPAVGISARCFFAGRAAGRGVKRSTAGSGSWGWPNTWQHFTHTSSQAPRGVSGEKTGFTHKWECYVSVMWENKAARLTCKIEASHTRWNCSLTQAASFYITAVQRRACAAWDEPFWAHRDSPAKCPVRGIMKIRRERLSLEKPSVDGYELQPQFSIHSQEAFC